MTTTYKLYFTALGLALLTACGANEDSQTSESVDDLALSVESGVLAVSDVADDSASSDSSKISQKSWIDSNTGTSSGKTVCSQVAAFQTCDSGQKSAQYNDCRPLLTLGTLSGFVNLDFSNSSCEFGTSGDQVSRTYDLSYSTERNRSIKVSSSEHNNYLEESLGGGGQLTRTSTGWEVSIPGKRRQLIGTSGQTLVDMSISTSLPIVVSGTLSRSNRVANGGELVIDHNLAGFTTIIRPVNLRWSDSCCHPVEGDLDIELTGSKEAEGVVRFSQCGKAELITGDEVRTLTLENCN